MPWNKVIGCPDYMGVNWIHPLKQRDVAKAVSYIVDNRIPIKALAVFGSAVNSRCRIDSDIDFVVWKDDGVRLTLPLENYDLLIANYISKTSELWKDICNEGVVVYVSDIKE